MAASLSLTSLFPHSDKPSCPGQVSSSHSLNTILEDDLGSSENKENQAANPVQANGGELNKRFVISNA